MPSRDFAEAAGEIVFEAEELEFLGALAAAGDLAEIIHQALGGSLTEVFRVAEEGEVGLAEERRQDADHQQQYQPGRVVEQGGGEDQGGDGLLKEPAHLLNEREAIGGLDAGALQAVVVTGVFVGGEVEASGLLHHTQADVVGIAVREQVVAVINEAAEEAGDDGEQHFESDDPPEVNRDRLAAEDVINAVDDPRSDFGDAPRGEGNEKAQGDAPDDDGAAGLPEDFQDGGDVFERANPLCPRTGLRGRSGFGSRHEKRLRMKAMPR